MAFSFHVMCYYHAAFLFWVPTWGLVFGVGGEHRFNLYFILRIHSLIVYPI